MTCKMEVNTVRTANMVTTSGAQLYARSTTPVDFEVSFDPDFESGWHFAKKDCDDAISFFQELKRHLND